MYENICSTGVVKQNYISYVQKMDTISWHISWKSVMREKLQILILMFKCDLSLTTSINVFNLKVTYQYEPDDFHKSLI